MNAIWKIFLSMSCSGGLLILVMLLGKRFLKDAVSRQWQYYIWLVVILRLLLPFGPETNLLGKTYQALDWAMNQASSPEQQVLPDAPGTVPVPTADLIQDSQSAYRSEEQDSQSAYRPEEQDSQSTYRPEEKLTAAHPLREIGELLASHIWLVWLVVSLVLLIRKVTIYESFVRYIRDGLTPVSDMEMLDRLGVIAEREGVKKPVELGVNPLISSPMLIGFFRPCIVLPGAEYGEKDFQYIVLHELTHYKRRDIFYKWLAQVTVCLHWFNPLVHLMGREITKACEFSCDEAVLAKTGDGSARDYGKTLLDAMAAVGKYTRTPGAVTLSENKQLLKERLGAIMVYQKRPKTVRTVTAVLTLAVIFGASFLGIYPVAAADVPNSADMEKASSSQPVNSQPSDDDSQGNFSHVDYAYPREAGEGVYHQGTGEEEHRVSDEEPGQTAGEEQNQAAGEERNRNAGEGYHQATGEEPGQAVGETLSETERYYEADSLPMFQIAFSRLDEETQGKWLDKIYTDNRITFWGAAVGLLEEDCALIRRYAEKTYGDGSVAYFSALAMHMSDGTLEEWLNRVLEDGNQAFQSVLFNALGWDEEYDKQGEKWEKEWDKEWEEAQIAEYGSVGVTIDGKNYYYQGQLVNIFLDVRADKSFYTLDLNPAGTVNIRIIRDADNKISGVSYMTDAEVAELFEEDDTGEEDIQNANTDKGDMKGSNMDKGGMKDDDIDDDLKDDVADGDAAEDTDENADDLNETAEGRIWYPQVIPVDFQMIKDGEAVWLGEYTLSEGDRIWYAVSAEIGNEMQVGFAEPGDELLDTVYYSVQNQRQKDENLECIASFTLRPPVKPGTYNLFLRATNGDLGNVRGSVSIGYVADAAYY